MKPDKCKIIGRDLTYENGREDGAADAQHVADIALADCKITDRNKEFILCAAIYYADGKKYVHQPKNIGHGFIITGRRHHNCIATFGILNRKKLMAYKKIRQHEGFLTNRDRFVTRFEGYEIAVAAGQTPPKHDPKWLKSIPQLYSEDLW